MVTFFCHQAAMHSNFLKIINNSHKQLGSEACALINEETKNKFMLMHKEHIKISIKKNLPENNV